MRGTKKRRISALVVFGMFVAMMLMGSVSADTDTGAWYRDDTNNYVYLSSNASGYYVGIGTATPTGILDVEGGSAAQDTAGTDITMDAEDGGTDGGTASSGQNGGDIIFTAGDGSAAVTSNADGGDGGNIILTPGSGQAGQGTGSAGSDGTVGIGTTNPDPDAILHVQDGTVLFQGTTGTTPVSGTGTRLMWIPEEAAFRAGKITSGPWSTWWDDASIGTASVAFGENTLASGSYSAAFGSKTQASGGSSFAVGSLSRAEGSGSIAMGTSVVATNAGANVAIGSESTASGSYSFALGRRLSVSGSHSFGIGLDSTSRTLSQANTMAIMGGDVGIGTLTPSHKLEISDADTTASRAGLYVEQSGGITGTGYGIYAKKTGTSTTNVAGYFSATGATNNYGLIVEDGNVGIGTTGPGVKLHTVATTEQLRLGYDTDSYASFTVGSTGVLTIQTTDTSGTTEDIELRTSGFDNAIYIDDSTSHVGIKTTVPLTTFDINGGLGTNIVTTTDSLYQATDDDFTILANGSSNAVTVKLPIANNEEGQILVIKAIDISNTVKVTTYNAATEIDGDSGDYTFSTQYESIMIQSDGSNWYILSGHL